MNTQPHANRCAAARSARCLWAVLAVAGAAARGVVVWHQEFETGGGGLTVSGTVGWQHGVPTAGPGRAHSGTRVWATNLAASYANNRLTYLTSPLLDLSPYSTGQVQLSWWQWLQTEPAWDTASVQASRDGGATWQMLYGPMSAAVDLRWRRYSLTADSRYLTPGFRFRFVFSSDETVTAPGWFLDDIAVAVTEAPASPLVADDLEGGVAGWAASGSWEWGVPTSGPGNAHSGTRAWATVLAGNYPNGDHAVLTTPLYDVSAAGSARVLLSWWQYLLTEPVYDRARAEVSRDGGTTWDRIYGEVTGSVAPEWSQVQVALPHSPSPTLAVRFTLTSDEYYTASGFYLDSLSLGALAADTLHDGAYPVLTAEDAAVLFGQALADAVAADGADWVRVTALPNHGALDLYGLPLVVDDLVDAWMLRAVRYTPEPNFGGEDSLRWRNGNALGQADHDALVALTVTPLPDAPTNLVCSVAAVPENAPSGTLLGTFSVTDPDPGDTLTCQVLSQSAGGQPGSWLAVDGTALVSALPLDREATPSVVLEVRATDSAGLSTSATFTLTVEDVPEPPVVHTGTVTDVTTDSLRLVGSSVTETGSPITSRGACWGRTPLPTVANCDGLVEAGSGPGSFDVTVTGLTPGATYYLHAFASALDLTAYGEERTATMPQRSQTITFPALAARAYGDPPFVVQATATSGLPVSLSSSDPAVAAVAGMTVTVHAAGTTDITATQPGNAEWAPAAPVTRLLTVQKAMPKIRWSSPAPIEYGVALSALQLSARASVPGTLVYDPPAGTVLHAGVRTLRVAFTPADPANWEAATAAVSLTVVRAPLTLTAADAVRRQGQANPPFTCTAEGLRNNDTIEGLGLALTYACNADPNSPPGAYPITPAGPATTADYTITYRAGTLTVTPRQIPTVTWATPGAITYGSPLSELQLNAAADTPGTFAYTPPVGTVLPTGNHLLRAVFTPADPVNWESVTATVTLTVGPAPLTVTADDQARLYGDADPAFTVSYAGFVNGDGPSDLATLPTATCAATQASHAGAYPITAAGGADANYSLAYVAGTLTISPAPLTCTAEDKSRPYGQANPQWTIAYTGLRNADPAPDVPPTASCSATPASPVGTYPITIEGGSDPDYVLGLVPGTLTILKAEQTIVFVPLPAKTYGDAPFALSAMATSGLPVEFTSSDPAVATVAGSTVAIVGAGTCMLTATQPGDGNWSAAPPVAQALTAGTALLTVTADDQARLYGDPNPVFTVSYAGFVNGDDASDLDTLPTAACTATQASHAGAYPIAAAGGADSNYSFAYVEGTLTVSPAPLTCTAEDKSRPYGQANPGWTTIYTGLRNADSAPDVPPLAACSATPASPVGAYPITIEGGSDADYVLTRVPGTLAVGRTPVTVTATDRTRTVGQENPPFTCTAMGLKNHETLASIGVTVAYACAATPASPAGAYPIVPSGSTETTNYSLTYVAGTLTVTDRQVPTVTWDAPQDLTYGTALSALQLNAAADTAGAFVYDPPAGTVLAAGEHLLEVVFTPADPITWETVTAAVLLMVHPASLTVTATDASRLYGDPNPAFTFSCSGFVNGDDASDLDALPTATCIADACSAAGGYAIALTGGADPDYALTLVPGVLTVTPALLTATADNQAIQYGDDLPVLTLTYAGLVCGDTAPAVPPMALCEATPESPPGVYPITLTGGADPSYSIVLVPGTLTIAARPGDFWGPDGRPDGQIDSLDLAFFAEQWHNRHGSPDLRCDIAPFVPPDDPIDGVAVPDGRVGSEDLGRFAALWDLRPRPWAGTGMRQQ